MEDKHAVAIRTTATRTTIILSVPVGTSNGVASAVGGQASVAGALYLISE